MPRPGSTPATALTHEDAVFAEQTVKEVARRIVIDEATYREIGDELGLDRKQVARLAACVQDRVTEETRADLAVWQAQKFRKMNRMINAIEEELLPDPKPDNHRLDAKLLSQYWQGLKTVVVVMTADRRADDLDKAIDDIADAAMQKAQLVQEYMQLADKVIAGINEHGYGSGVAPDETDVDDEELDPAYARADNSHTIDDAVVLDGSDGFVESDLDALEGEWIDGKFVAAGTNAADKEE